MNLKDLMQTSPDGLAKAQFEELKKHVVNTLNKVKVAVETENFDSIKEMLFHSRAGDGYGSDNHCIDFSYDENVKDIWEVIDTLKYLREQAKPKPKDIFRKNKR